MGFFKQKKNILFILCLAAGLFTFLTLLFALVHFGGEGQNGFDAIKGEHWDLVYGKGLAAFSKILAIVLILASVAIIVCSIIAYVKGADMGKIALIIVIIAAVLAVLYLIDGIALKGKYDGLIDMKTAAFWPLIFQALICGGVICASKVMKE